MSWPFVFTKLPVKSAFRKNSKFCCQLCIPTAIQALHSSSIHVRKLKAKESAEAMKFVRNRYVSDESLMKGLGVEENCLSPVLTEFIRNQIDHGMTCVAVSSQKQPNTDLKCFGIAINTNIVPWDPDMWNSLCKCIRCERTRDLIALWSRLIKESDIFARLNTSKIFNIAHVLVNEEVIKLQNPQMTAHNLSCLLVDKSLRMVKLRRYSNALMSCSGTALSNVANDCDMQLIYDFPYCKLLNEKSQPIVKSVEPNRNVQLYYKQLRV